MIPINNPQKFEEKYGKLWYIREFDYFPQELKYYSKNLSAQFMKYLDKFDIFNSYDEAKKVSDKIRTLRNLI